MDGLPRFTNRSCSHAVGWAEGSAHIVADWAAIGPVVAKAIALLRASPLKASPAPTPAQQQAQQQQRHLGSSAGNASNLLDRQVLPGRAVHRQAGSNQGLQQGLGQGLESADVVEDSSKAREARRRENSKVKAAFIRRRFRREMFYLATH